MILCHISHLNSALSNSPMEKMESRPVTVIYHTFTSISHYSYEVPSLELCFTTPSVFLLYYQHVTKARAFEFILFQAM